MATMTPPLSLTHPRQLHSKPAEEMDCEENEVNLPPELWKCLLITFFKQLTTIEAKEVTQTNSQRKNLKLVSPGWIFGGIGFVALVLWQFQGGYGTAISHSEETLIEHIFTDEEDEDEEDGKEE